MSTVKTKRNEEIQKLILKGETFQSIGEKFGISKQRVRQLAVGLGVSRWKEKRALKKTRFKAFIKDIKARMLVSEMAVKHNLSEKEVREIYKHQTGELLLTVLREKRDSKIVKDFKAGSTAISIVKNPSEILKNPLKITTTNNIYSINTRNGVKRYPEVGNRSKGGTFQNKRVINLIVNRRDKGQTFGEILTEMNERGYRTVTGRIFKQSNIAQIYYYAKNKLNY